MCAVRREPYNAKRRITMEKIGIIILSHSNMCQGMLDSAQMLFGTLEDARAVPFLQGQTLEDYQKQVEEALDELGESSLILVDLMGGTPYNTVMRIGKSREVFAVCGMNLPMLIHAADLRAQGMTIQKIMEEICAIGQQGIGNMTESIERIRKKLEAKR